MKIYNEEDYLNLAGIQHFAFCQRQWALIHIEKLWKDNLRTVEGELLHKKTHDGYYFEKRGDLLISRGMPVFSKSLGINGICDVVEFHLSKTGIQLFGRDGKYKVYPVEYKRGKPKDSIIDILQLTAQAMCLEEMLCCDIAEGYLYYGETRHRVKVCLDESYRSEVRDALDLMHQYYNRDYTPKVKPSKSCKACSLKDLCIPNLSRCRSVSGYIQDMIEED
ncbi:MAG: CRISPR-associated protein Cas4 [Clostridiaceae bacterium]|jgi:CRISPR-associated exonuclease Cas4|nr:CRISPR-associated protein Cas4 [Clostridiaceae bacterium]